MAELLNQKEIEIQVKAHIGRLKNRVESSKSSVSISQVNIDPQFFKEDEIALDQVKNILNDNKFKKKLCSGLEKTSSDLGELAKPISTLLLPASVATSGPIELLGYTWTFGALPIGIIGASILAIYLARFGIGYFCGDQKA